MKKYIAEINVMPLKNLLDPQGKAVFNSMQKMGFEEVSSVRIGKHITMELEAESKEKAMEKVNEACNKILANPVMEGYDYTVEEADN
ncbi:MAG: phosphoribosylformylglycinamidine synthase subunit PurS [Bacteroidales bacterium]|nr:phosphoribosylformylglycinamidine synthase subunit PurS [Bacteroidales bacterium]MBS3773875.1 phosphoribosylformylglycinamidine synthase subunit PurS [Bacteroidales bacterium]